MPYKPTGRPVGRPPKMPSNADELIMENMRSRMNAETRLVLPEITTLAHEFNVSRSSIKRVVKKLRDNGYLEIECIYVKPESKRMTIFYRVLK